MQARLFLLACIMLVAVLFIPSQVFAGSGLLNVVGEVQDDVSQVTNNLVIEDTSKDSQLKKTKNSDQQQEEEKSSSSLTGVVSGSVETVSQTVNDVTNEVTEVTEEVGDVTNDVTNEVTEVAETVGDVTNGVTDGVTEVTEEVNDVANNVTEEVTSVTTEVDNVTEEVTREVTETTEEVTDTTEDVEVSVDTNNQDENPDNQVGIDEEISVKDKVEDLSENDKPKIKPNETSMSDAKVKDLAALFETESSSSVKNKTETQAT